MGHVSQSLGRRHFQWFGYDSERASCGLQTTFGYTLLSCGFALLGLVCSESAILFITLARAGRDLGAGVLCAVLDS